MSVGGADTLVVGLNAKGIFSEDRQGYEGKYKVYAQGIRQKPGKNLRRRTGKGDPDWREKVAPQKIPEGCQR